MSKFILSTCSTIDLLEEHVKQREIEMVYLKYTIEGKIYSDDFWKSIPTKEFYERIENGAMPTTSQVNVGEYLEFFEKQLEAGYDVLHLAFSGGLSGTYNSAMIAKTELEEKYPDRKISVIDTVGASVGSGLLVDMVADMRDNGATLEELTNWTEENKCKVNHWFYTTDLTHFKRGGRISPAQAAIGSLLNICPLLKVDKDGKLQPVEKVRGKKKIVKKILGKMIDNADNGLEYSGKCYIAHSAREEDAKKLAQLVEETFPNVEKPIFINSIGAIIGSHTGPGTVAVCFMGESRK